MTDCLATQINLPSLFLFLEVLFGTPRSVSVSLLPVLGTDAQLPDLTIRPAIQRRAKPV